MPSEDQALLLQRQDLVELGSRIRDARRVAGLGQADVAAAVGVSISYVSRIEAGKRRCDLALLTRIAGCLDVTVESLLTSADDLSAERLSAGRRAELDFVGVALDVGDNVVALDRLDALAATASGPPTRTELVLRGRALEGLGRLEQALEVLEQIQLPGPDPIADVAVAIALSRCYRESGEAVRAIRVGEEALAALGDAQFEGSDEAVQLAVTVAAAYFEQGDREYAVRLCRRTLAAAEQGGSPRARASAYWNLAMVQVEGGHVEGGVQMARRALALMSEGQDEQNLARLRAELGLMELRLSPPDLDGARSHLEQARAEFETNGKQVDLERLRAAMAELRRLSGEPELARDEALAVTERLRGTRPQLEAEALVTAGEASLALGEIDRAHDCFLSAVRLMSKANDLRTVGQLWLELGSRLQEVGDVAAAADAFHRAAVAAGLTPSVAVQARALTTDPPG